MWSGKGGGRRVRQNARASGRAQVLQVAGDYITNAPHPPAAPRRSLARGVEIALGICAVAALPLGNLLGLPLGWSVLAALMPAGAGLAVARSARMGADHARESDYWMSALAAEVTATETAQRAQLTGEGAHRINLSYRVVRAGRDDASAAGANGRLTGVLTLYRALSPQRLVITGAAGSGKTAVATELLLGLLDADSDGPVPVRISLTSWDTTTPFEEWLAQEVSSQLPPKVLSLRTARGLVTRRRVLPVLDGLDEMDTGFAAPPRPRAAMAVEAINLYQDARGLAALVLTCRSDAYAELAAAGIRIRGAAHLTLDSLTLGQARVYLKSRGADLRRWEPLLRLRRRPESEPPLFSVLSTPWLLNLALTAYEERDPRSLAHRRDPSELLRFSDANALRNHLLALYVPALTRQHPSAPDRYDARDVHRWLSVLSRHLHGPTAGEQNGHRSDILLHELWPSAGQRLVRCADLILTTSHAAVAVWLYFRAFGDQMIPYSTTFALLVLTTWLLVRSARNGSPAPTVPPKIRGQSPVTRRMSRREFASGAMLGVGLGFPYFSWRYAGYEYGLLVSVVGAAWWGVMFGAFGVWAWSKEQQESEGQRRLTDPWKPLVFETMLVVAGSMLALLALVLFGGVVAAFVIVLCQLGSCVGRRFLVFLFCARARRRLPVELVVFLRWARAGGMLRQSGVAYRFRHQELQEWLARHPLPPNKGA